MRSKDHDSELGYDGDSWILSCACGKHIGQFITADEANDAFSDHVAAAYER